MTRRTMVSSILAAAAAGASPIDRRKPPETPPLAPYKLPPVTEKTLPNGLRVVMLEDRRFPMVTLRLAFSAGSKFDPPEKSGLAETVAAVLKEGTPKRKSQQIAEELATLGASLNTSASADNLSLAANVLAENMPGLLDLVADVARNAVFPEEEVALRKQNREQELAAARAQSDTLAEERFTALVFGAHPYGRFLPTAESIARIDRAALAGFRDRMLAPNNAVLILLGALPSPAAALKLVESKFGDWARKPVPAPPAAKFPEAKRSLILIDRPDSVQADIRVGQFAVPRPHPDYFPLMVGNSILGGGANSRMFLNIREEKGFAYDAHSELQARKDASLFAAVTQVRNEVIGEAVEAVLHELDRMGQERVSAQELSEVKNYLNGVFVLRLETQDGLANQLAMTRTMGLPESYLETYVTRIRSVEPDQIQGAAKKYVTPEDAAIVVVGDAQKLAKPLEKFGPVSIEKAKQ
ncbi:MAG: insulinase family protein [Acidobacteria bacterium]|nr:insulinase family protein [Acidobacteriota bacterium]